MNLKRLQRKAHLLSLHAQVFLAWVPLQFEPPGTGAYRVLRADFKYAQNRLNQALLREREARMNRRAF